METGRRLGPGRVSQNVDPLTASPDVKSTARPERILFVTGRLAEFALRRTLEPLAKQVGFAYEVEVLGISVAVLVHGGLVGRQTRAAQGFDRVILPGWCQGDLSALARAYQRPVELGPKDLHDLPEFFGRGQRPAVALEE